MGSNRLVPRHPNIYLWGVALSMYPDRIRLNEITFLAIYSYSGESSIPQWAFMHLIFTVYSE